MAGKAGEIAAVSARGLARGVRADMRTAPPDGIQVLDAIGPVMGMATIPMAVFTIASVVAGAALLLLGDWRPVVGGVVAALLCYLLARPLERVAIATDTQAAVALSRRHRGRARVLATVSAVVPMLVILSAEMAVVRRITMTTGAAPTLGWLWGYGVATAPWTVFAARVSRFRRTLASIRAYSGHVALWLLGMALLAGAPFGLAAVVGLLAAWLPLAVGILLALADRGAISDVRI